MTSTLTEEIKEFALIPTIDFLKKQADFFFSGSNAGVGLSRQTPTISGTNPYIVSETGKSFLSNSLPSFAQVEITPTYSEEEAIYFASISSLLSIKLRGSARYESLFLYSGTNVLLVNNKDINAPPKADFVTIQEQTFGTDATEYFLGLATDVELNYHSTTEGRIVSFNSIQEFYDNEVRRQKIEGTNIDFLFCESCTSVLSSFEVILESNTSSYYYNNIFLFSTTPEKLLFVAETGTITGWVPGTLEIQDWATNPGFEPITEIELQVQTYWENTDIVVF